MEGSFLDLVDDVTRLDSSSRSRNRPGRTTWTSWSLVPKKEGTLQSARIWVDGRLSSGRMEIIEITGNVNVIDFSTIEVNKPLSDASLSSSRATKRSKSQ